MTRTLITHEWRDPPRNPAAPGTCPWIGCTMRQAESFAEQGFDVRPNPGFVAWYEQVMAPQPETRRRA